MVIATVVLLLLCATVLLILGRRGWRPSTKLIAIGLLGLGTALFLVFGLAELLGGDITGIQHLIPAAILAVLMYVGWRRPHAAGIALLVVAAALTAAGVSLFIARDLPLLSLALLFVLPSVVTGVLLVLDDRHESGLH